MTGLDIRAELADIWRQVMGAAPDDADDSFFAAGGTSLRAVQLIGRIEEAFDLRLPLSVVYAEGSFNRLIELVEEELLAAFDEWSEEAALRLLQDGERASGVPGPA